MIVKRCLNCDFIDAFDEDSRVGKKCSKCGSKALIDYTERKQQILGCKDSKPREWVNPYKDEEWITFYKDCEDFLNYSYNINGHKL